MFEDDFNAFKVHIMLQQRNGRKCLTIIEDLPSDLDLKKILKYLKKQLSTNGSIKEEEIIILQGDKRHDVRKFLIDNGICEEENIVIHG